MSETFHESYGVLQKHALTLRKQSEPNIDDLLTIVEESVAPYKVCQARIDAVEAALEKALDNAQAPATETKVQKPQGRAKAPKRLETTTYRFEFGVGTCPHN